MPGTQPRGTHSFDPDSSSQSSTQLLNIINTEEDGAEDQVGPPSDLPMANLNMPAAPFVPPDFDIDSIQDAFSFTSSLPPPDCSAGFSSSGSTRPPPSSSLLPTVLPHPTQQRDVSMGSVKSITTGSDPGTGSEPRKRKHDARSVSGAHPRSAKRASKNKTDDLNPVIISNALNSTFNRIVDVMERSLDATAIATSATPMTAPTTSVAPPSIIASSIEFQTAQLSSTPSQPLGPPSNPSSAPLSNAEALDQRIRLISADDSGLTEDELLSASMFFTSASEEAVRAARTFLALGNNRIVRHRFLIRQLNTAALLPGKGKAKAVEDDMMY